MSKVTSILGDIYTELTNSFEFEVNGEKKTKSQVYADRMSQDEEIRKESHRALHEKYGDNKIDLGVQPTRIDWVMQSIDNENLLPGSAFGAFTDNLDSFLTIISRWLKIAPPLTRIAFGSVLSFPVDTRETGYELLAKHLPKVQLDSVGTSDFLYQINRPRTSHSEIPDLKINRLTKWSVQKRGFAHFGFLPDASVSVIPSSETISCRLELDTNTSADFKSDLPQDKLTDIFNMEVNRTLASVAERTGMTQVVVTHDEYLARDVASAVYALEDGRLRKLDGPPNPARRGSP